jgi:hypothetical protein
MGLLLSMASFARTNGLITSQQYRSLRGQLNGSPFANTVAAQVFLARLGFSYGMYQVQTFYGMQLQPIALYNGVQIG